MTASNSDQDEFDPNLEEGGEDFAYEEESFEDSEFSEEDSWDEEGFESESGDESGEGDGQSEEQPAKKKKGGLFNVILILLALVGGGGFIYLKVLSPAGQATAPQQAEAPATPAVEQQAEVPPPVAPEQPALAATDPLMPPPAGTTADALPPATPDVAAPALTPELTDAPPALADAPVEPAALTAEPAVPAPVAEQPVPAPAQPVEVASAPPMPSPISAPEPTAEGGFSGTLPSAKDIMLASPSAAKTPATDVAPSGISADAAKSIEQKLSVLLARLDTFEGRIANLENGIHQTSSEVSALKAKPAPVADLSAINQSVAKLEQKIASLESGSSTPAATPVAAKPAESPVAAAPAPADVAAIEKPTFIPAAEEEPAKPAAPAINAVDTPKTTETPAIVKTEKPVAPKVTSWVLRSAQPGTAMVAPKDGGDMRSIKVGDTLSGIGRIVAIEMADGRWVVRGTSGTITR